MTLYDITKFHGHWSSNREVTQGGGAESAALGVLDSKKPGLFRVNFDLHLIGRFQNLECKSAKIGQNRVSILYKNADW